MNKTALYQDIETLKSNQTEIPEMNNSIKDIKNEHKK